MANVWTTSGVGDVAHEVDPISRIEGHLGVKVTVNGSGVITDANAHGNLWRGFENFLLGRDVNDAITFVQRICGVCPVPHGMTSTFAVDNVLGYSKGHITFATAVESGRTYGVPEKAVLIRNMVLGAEFLMSSITHFYHLAAPSYVQGPAIPPWTPFFDNSYYHVKLRGADSARADLAAGAVGIIPNPVPSQMHLWDAVILSYVKALRIRRMTFEAAALFAGRMPMTSCLVGGGVTNDGTEDLTARATAFRSIIREVGLFVVQEYVPIALALGALYPAFDNVGNQPVSGGSGAGLGRYLSWGGLPTIDASGTLVLPGGVFDANTSGHVTSGAYDVDVTHFRAINKADVYAMFLDGGKYSVSGNLTEDIAHSRYSIAAADTGVYTGTKAYPGDVARTKPARASGYTYMKAPRWNNQAFEVGPLARMAVAGYYPVDNVSTLLSTFPGYSLYTTATTGGLNAIDIRPDVMISTNVLSGLINSGLASTVTGYIAGLIGGRSTMDRLRGRALESLVIVQALVGSLSKNDVAGTLSFGSDGFADQLISKTGTAPKDTAYSTWRARPGATAYYNPYGTIHGWGGTEAPRGALMHHTTISNGKIVKYQCIVPTTWNGSPKDTAGNRGAIEQAVVGASFSSAGAVYVKQSSTTADGTGAGGVTGTTAGGVEVLRIAQSFDPCIACAIH